jgi:hypothetical protein
LLHMQGLTTANKYPALLFSEELFSGTRLDQVNQFAQFTKSIKNNLIMQNKPNLCRFQAVNRDCTKKQTQTNPIQTQNKAIFTPKNRPQTQTNPIQTQNLPADAVWRANPISNAIHLCRLQDFFGKICKKYLTKCKVSFTLPFVLNNTIMGVNSSRERRKS